MFALFFGGATRKRDYAGNWCDLNKIGTCDPDAPTIDHLQPLAQGGKDTVDNYVVCSYLTNCTKGNMWPTWKIRNATYNGRLINGKMTIVKQDLNIVAASGLPRRIDYDAVSIDSVIETPNGKTALIIFTDGSIFKAPTKLSKSDWKKSFVYKAVYERIFGSTSPKINRKYVLRETAPKKTGKLRDGATGRFMKLTKEGK